MKSWKAANLACLRTVAVVVIVIWVAGVWPALVGLMVGVCLLNYVGLIGGLKRSSGNKLRRGIQPSK